MRARTFVPRGFFIVRASPSITILRGAWNEPAVLRNMHDRDLPTYVVRAWTMLSIRTRICVLRVRVQLIGHL
eukprot:COSAG05_NODE_2892_length_2535_cov_2.408867_4_plen_72_part_00